MRAVSPHARLKRVRMSEGIAILTVTPRTPTCRCADCRMAGKTYLLKFEHADEVGRWYERTQNPSKSLVGLLELDKSESPTYIPQIGRQSLSRRRRSWLDIPHSLKGKVNKMIIMKESNGASFQYRAFEKLSAVAKFFENDSGRVFPKTLYNGTQIVSQPELTEDNLDNWTPINTTGCIGHFECIQADVSDIEIPENLKWFDGRSNAFGRSQAYIPNMTQFLNP